jgi:hypothetical protein
MTPKGKVTFRCPYCSQKLSFLDGSMVKLAGRLHADTFSCKTMFYIPATLGEYGAIVGEGVRLEDGAVVEFECINGACKQSLTSRYDDNLAEIRMVDESGQEFAVAFNRIYGRRATFLIDIKRTSVLESYGEHAAEYALTFEKRLNYFGS